MPIEVKKLQKVKMNFPIPSFLRGIVEHYHSLEWNSTLIQAQHYLDPLISSL